MFATSEARFSSLLFYSVVSGKGVHLNTRCNGCSEYFDLPQGEQFVPAPCDCSTNTQESSLQEEVQYEAQARDHA